MLLLIINKELNSKGYYNDSLDNELERIILGYELVD